MRKFLASLTVVTGLIAGGCGTAGEEDILRADASGEIVIDMDEFTFGTKVIEATAGETITFVLINAGDNEHEFMIGRDLVETEEGYPNGFEHDFFEAITPLVDPPSAGMDMGAMDMDDMDMGAMDMADDDDGHGADDMDGMDMAEGDDMDGMDMAEGDDMDGMDMAEGDDMDGMDMAEGDDMDGMDMAEGDDMDGMDMDDGDMAMDMDDGDMAMDMDEDDEGHGDDEMDVGGMDIAGMDHAGFMVQRRPGEVARLTVTIPEDAVGDWQIGCFRGRGAHWDAGMRATFVVRAA